MVGGMGQKQAKENVINKLRRQLGIRSPKMAGEQGIDYLLYYSRDLIFGCTAYHEIQTLWRRGYGVPFAVHTELNTVPYRITSK